MVKNPDDHVKTHGWRCSKCGRHHDFYIGRCRCGMIIVDHNGTTDETMIIGEDG